MQISVVVPCYNEEDLLPFCVYSINRELQGHEYEIIVVDNGSTDETVKLALQLGCKVVTESKKGITRARQRGLNEAQYELIAFIDADNVLPQGWLKYTHDAMCEPDAVAASGPVVYYDLRRHKRIVVFIFYLFAKITNPLFPVLQGGNFVLMKTPFIKAGGFDTSIEFFGEDTATAARLFTVGKVVFDLDMFVYSSGRRMQVEGLIVTGVRYLLNFFWIHLFDRPFTSKYQDIRPE